MTAHDLTNPIYHDEDKARGHFEAIRWPNGPECPHCGIVGEATELQGKSTRPGVYKCRACRKPFSATVGTLFERSHIPLCKWLLAVHLMTSSKKGMSAHQLWRMLGVGSYRTAWFMAHRIRESFREFHPVATGPLSGKGKAVEADETYIGGREKNKHRSKRTKGNIGGTGKEIVFGLVERGGRVRTQHVPNVTSETLREVLVAQVDRKSTLMTDDAGQYRVVSREFDRHEAINHGIEEYVRGDAHTNTIEGYFSILKRGINGVYHHVSQKHLKRYLGEFDFRYNERTALGVNDKDRAVMSLKGIKGKRLTYRQPDRASSGTAD
jgi:transposase-like protein